MKHEISIKIILRKSDIDWLLENKFLATSIYSRDSLSISISYEEELTDGC